MEIDYIGWLQSSTILLFVLFSVTVIPHCSSNVKVWALQGPIHDCVPLCVFLFSCVSCCQWFLGLTVFLLSSTFVKHTLHTIQIDGNFSANSSLVCIGRLCELDVLSWSNPRGINAPSWNQTRDRLLIRWVRKTSAKEMERMYVSLWQVASNTVFKDTV